MKNLVAHHPSIILTSLIKDICKPLKQLKIDYFAHVLVTPQNEFSFITSNGFFTEYYLNNKCYEVDLHMEKSKFTPYMIMDMHELKGSTAQLQSEAAMLGVKHIFTIIEENSEGGHFFHFGNAGNCFSINQSYLSNLDLLKTFISYFKEIIKNSKELKIAHDLKFRIPLEAQGYQRVSAVQEVNDTNRQEFLQLIEARCGINLNTNLILLNKINKQPVKLTVQQSKCMNLLALGNTNKQIATALGLSIRTVHHYLDRVRYLLNCHSSKELITHFIM